ncbi:MDR family MFS transporter [Tepidibacillus sp. LV47]|uniref:MDR family MFS transporter n=1 Tax=Tepidibacillus sp. LV47 TaxID=3398228 RepID=UPI003AADBC07
MEHLERKKKITIMLTILVSMLFSSLSQTIVDTALPRIVADLGGMDYYTWIYTIYMLSTSIMVILVGKLSDIYGRKVFLLSGIAVFMLGAFLSGTATSMLQLIIYRGIQGLGGGTIMSASMTTVADLFSPAERGRWQGVMGAVFGLSSVIGPTLGGYIVDHWEWHWIFWIFLPLGFVALFFIYTLYPKHNFHGQREKVDYYGALFLVITLIPLLLGFTWAGTKYNWSSMQIISLFSVATIGLILFLIAESKVENPILPLHLFKNSIFTISNLMGFLIGMGMFGSVMFIPLFVQGVIGSSATQSGVILMPMTLSLVIASTISGQITSRTGKYKFLAIIGIAIVTIGMFLLSRMTIDTTNTTVTLNMIVLGSGLGVVMPLFVLTVQNAVPKRLLGVATSAVQLFRQIGGTVGVSIMGTIMSHSMNRNLAKEIPPQAKHLMETIGLDHVKNPQVLFDPERITQLKAMIPAKAIHIFNQVLEAIRVSLASAIKDVFFYGFLIMLVNIVFVFFLKEVPLRKSTKEIGHIESELTELN